MNRSSFAKKSLAVAATGSLAVMGFAAPAQAVTGITLAPLNGTSTGAIVGSTFMLKAGVAGADSDNISFTIEGADASEVYADIVNEDSVAGLQASDVTVSPFLLTADADDTWGTTDGDDDDIVNYVNANGVLAISSALDDDDDDTTAAAAGTFTSGDETKATSGDPYFIVALALDASEFEDGVDLTVTAFEDGNLNGVYDADLGEEKSDSVEVSFIPSDEVTGTVTQVITPGAANGTAKVEARVVLTNVNMGSMEDGDGDTNDIDRLAAFEVLVDGTVDEDTDVGDGGSLIEPADFDDTDDRFEVEVAMGNKAIANGDTVVTRVYIGELTATAANRLGQARVGLNAEIDAFAGDAGGAANHIEVSDTQQLVIDNNSGAADIRPGDGSFTVFVDALDSDSDAVGAGLDVVFTVSEDSNTFDSAVKLTSGGNTLTNSDTDDNGESFDVTVQTNADGRASLTVSYEDLDNADTFTIDANVTSSTATAALDFTASEADGIELYVTNTDTNGSHVAELGSRISVDLVLRDEYGLAPANDHRVAYTISSSEMNSNITGTVVFPGGSGNATVLWNDTSDDVADITFAITNTDLEAKDSDGDYGAPTDDPTSSISHTIVIVEDQNAVDDVNIDDGNSDGTAAALFGYTYAPVDLFNVNSNFVTSQQTVSDNTQSIDVDVLDEDNVGLEGIAVTFSAEDAIFADETEDDSQGYSVNSHTAYTDANGNVVVAWDSNRAGTWDITVTAGGKSDTIEVTVTRPSDDGDADSWVIANTSSYVSPQSTLSVNATLVDEYGNGIDQSTAGDIEVSYAGPGIQIPAASTLDKTSSKGVVTFAVFFGVADTGTHTVTFTHEGDDGDLTATEDNVVAIYTFTIGEEPAAQKVNAGSFKGYVAVYARGYEGQRLSAKIGADWVIVDPIVNNQGADLHRTVDLTGAGVDITVRIYIDRVLTATIPLTTK